MTDDRSVGAGTWIGFSAMTLGMFMAVLDIQIVVTSLPEISEALDIAPDKMSWVQTAYLMAELVMIPFSAFLAQAMSTRWLFATSAALFFDVMANASAIVAASTPLSVRLSIHANLS